MKYKCDLCGYIANLDEYNEEDFRCPLCGVSKNEFTVYEEVEEVNKRVRIDDDNPSINRVMEKCINCGICKKTCKEKTGIVYDDVNSKCAMCVNCGACILNCPTGALTPKYNYKEVQDILSSKEDKVLVAFTAPAVRIALGEAFGMEFGTNIQSKMVEALRKLGFSYVFDTTLGADMTIMEEVTELIDRINKNENLPMFTSCCPSWVKYVEMFYPEMIKNISTTKSPNAIMGALVKSYFAEKLGLDKDKIITVGIVPCTAKKFEITRNQIKKDVDYMLTTTELALMIRENNINFKNLSEGEFDNICVGSTAGLIFGSSGGVMEASIRTLKFMLSGKNFEDYETFKILRSDDCFKEALIKINDKEYKVLVIYGLTNAKKVLEKIKNKEECYHFIEVMACENGCVGGAGQPLQNFNIIKEARKDRLNTLFSIDNLSSIRCSHDNELVKEIYKSYLKEPGSELAHELLHIDYSNEEK